jgi:cobalt/nickel transport system ATP-binding protein
VDDRQYLLKWLSLQQDISIGAMGTRAKQHAENSRIALDFTYGVIDKCILKALLGGDSLILTTESMVRRVSQRVDAYGQESGIIIPVQPLDSVTEATENKKGDIS